MTGPRVVLITGASSGIGEATARAAAARGDHVVLVARAESALTRVEKACVEAGAASTLVVPTDVGDDDAVRRMVTVAVDRYGRLDIVVSNAGVVAYGRFDQVPAQVIDGVFATNLHGAVHLARHVLPVLRAQDAGSLVLVGSLLGHIAAPDMGAYVVSKWGVRGLVRQLRVDNRDRPGIKIGYVVPGGVDTPIYAQAATYGGSVGRPPFPVATPEAVGRRVLTIADRPWWRSQVGPANDVIKLGFTALPWVYDRLVGPLFTVLAQDLTQPVEDNPGNVLESRPASNGLRGGWGNALIAVGRNLAALRKRQESDT